MIINRSTYYDQIKCRTVQRFERGTFRFPSYTLGKVSLPIQLARFVPTWFLVQEKVFQRLISTSLIPEPTAVPEQLPRIFRLLSMNAKVRTLTRFVCWNNFLTGRQRKGEREKEKEKRRKKGEKKEKKRENERKKKERKKKKQKQKKEKKKKEKI